MRIVGLLVMALGITLAGIGNASSSLPRGFLCDEEIVMEGGGCCGAPIVGWYTSCDEGQGACAGHGGWNSGCDSLCCDGDAWIVEESCIQCWRV
jgi:hypothetical protein